MFYIVCHQKVQIQTSQNHKPIRTAQIPKTDTNHWMEQRVCPHSARKHGRDLQKQLTTQSPKPAIHQEAGNISTRPPTWWLWQLWELRTAGSNQSIPYLVSGQTTAPPSWNIMLEPWSHQDLRSWPTKPTCSMTAIIAILEKTKIFVERTSRDCWGGDTERRHRDMAQNF